MPLLRGNRDELGQYLRDLADLMGLRDWYFQLASDEPSDDTRGAECEVTYGQKHAVIRFRKDWPTWPAEDLRWLAVHELVHCHTWSMEQRVADLQSSIGALVYSVLEPAFRDDLEHAVDGIARAWAEFLPLPMRRKVAKKEAA